MRGPAIVAAAAALVAILAVSSGAAAQGADTTVDLTISDLPEDPMVLRDNSSETATFTVTLHAENFACTEEGTLPVEGSVAASPGAVDEFTLDPARLNFTAPPGTYSSTNPYNESMEADFTATVNGEVPQNHTHEPTIELAFLPGEVENCGSASGFPDASASDSVTVEMVASQDDASGPGAGGGSDGGGSDDVGSDDGGGIPGPGAAAAAVALAAGARALRRR